METVSFIYGDGAGHDGQVETLIRERMEQLRTRLSLPKELQVQFEILPPGELGRTTVNPRMRNRIILDARLRGSFLVEALVHELIHIEQMFTGRLSCRANGVIVWDTVPYPLFEDIDHQTYLALPWEVDVRSRIGEFL